MLQICCPVMIRTTWETILYVTKQNYVVQNRYNNHCHNLNINSSILGSCKRHSSIIQSIEVCVVRGDTTMIWIISLWILVSADNANIILVSYVEICYPIKTLTTWCMLVHLTRYEFVIENWYYSHSFNSNVTTTISGWCKENFSIIYNIYAVQRDTNN
jgi:hypothetical protein